MSCQFACRTPWFQRGDQDAVTAFDLSIDGHRHDRFCWVAIGPSCQVLDNEKPLTARPLHKAKTTRGWCHSPGIKACALGVVVHGELVGVGPLAQLLHLLVFHRNPVVDEVFGEDTAGEQVILVGLEGLEGAVER